MVTIAGNRAMRAALIGSLMLSGMGAAQAQDLLPVVPPAPIEGVWLTTERSEITIAPCELGYCGAISKIVVPERYVAQYGAALDNFDPATYTDVNNQDPALRTRPILGLRILTLRPTDRPEYFEGEIYNPEDGNIYQGSVEALGTGEIRLKGCVLYVLCQDQVWQRAPAPPVETEATTQ